MAAFNVVRFKVKPGFEQQFIDHHRAARPALPGFLGANLVRTGEQSFCIVGEWRNMNSLAAARPQLIALLDGMRHMLEDLGGGLGLTDPVSGDVAAKMAASKPPKKRASTARKTKPKKAARKAAKKRALAKS
jgi:hypothetical protein